VAAEEALALMSGAMQVVSVRLFGVFGPGQREGLVPGLIQRIREGRPVELEPSARTPADQEGLRLSLSFVEDVADCLRRIADLAVEGRTIPSPLNVAGPRALSIRELAGQLGVHLGVAPGYRVLARQRDTDYVADIQRLEQIVGPVFTPLEEAIARTVDEPASARTGP
jgi:nucleoside-diphosphate-sugar epimerase